MADVSTCSNAKSEWENMSLTFEATKTFNQWNSKGVPGKMGAHVVGPIVTPVTLVLDALFHVNSALLKAPICLIAYPVVCVIKIVRSDVELPKDWAIDSPLLHLSQTIDSLVHLLIIPVAAIFSPDGVYKLIEEKYGNRCVDEKEEQEEILQTLKTTQDPDVGRELKKTSCCHAKSELERVSITHLLTQQLYEWSQSESKAVNGATRIAGFVLVPLTLLADSLVHVGFGAAKIVIYPVAYPLVCAAKVINPKLEAPKDLGMNSPLLHLTQSVNSLVHVPLMLVAALASPANAHAVMEERYGDSCTPKKERDYQQIVLLREEFTQQQQQFAQFLQPPPPSSPTTTQQPASRKTQPSIAGVPPQSPSRGGEATQVLPHWPTPIKRDIRGGSIVLRSISLPSLCSCPQVQHNFGTTEEEINKLVKSAVGMKHGTTVRNNLTKFIAGLQQLKQKETPVRWRKNYANMYCELDFKATLATYEKAQKDGQAAEFLTNEIQYYQKVLDLLEKERTRKVGSVKKHQAAGEESYRRQQALQAKREKEVLCQRKQKMLRTLTDYKVPSDVTQIVFQNAINVLRGERHLEQNVKDKLNSLFPVADVNWQEWIRKYNDCFRSVEAWLESEQTKLEDGDMMTLFHTLEQIGHCSFSSTAKIRTNR